MSTLEWICNATREQDYTLDLQEKEMLRDVLHQLLFSVLRVKFGQEVKGDWFLLWNLLIQHLQQHTKEMNNHSVPALYLQ